MKYIATDLKAEVWESFVRPKPDCPIHQATAKKAQIDDWWVIDLSVLYSLSGPRSMDQEKFNAICAREAAGLT